MDPSPGFRAGAFTAGRSAATVRAMSATLHTLRPDQGPPETDFEREAVTALLERIREFRADAGYEPDGLCYVLLARSPDGGTLTRRRGWYDTSPDSTIMRLALSGALLTDAAVNP